VEGSGAVVLAALLNQCIAGTSGKTVAALLTGRNVSTERLKALLSSVLNLKLAER
jgi:threonine dehydratase